LDYLVDLLNLVFIQVLEFLSRFRLRSSFTQASTSDSGRREAMPAKNNPFPEYQRQLKKTKTNSDRLMMQQIFAAAKLMG